jgi:hypothetical protein
MPYLVIDLASGKRIVADGSLYEYLAMELVGDELGPIRLSLHGHRMVAKDQMEVVHWNDERIAKNDHILLALARDAVPTAPETAQVSEISVEAIQRGLDDLSRQLASIRRPAAPQPKRISGALRFRVTTDKHPDLQLSTASEQYVQVNGVWSGEENLFAMEGRSFSSDGNGHPHSFRTWFKDVLHVGDRASIGIESAI